MSDENPTQRNTDFFSDLMFGTRPAAAEQHTINDSNPETNEGPSSQLEQILTLVQTVGPALEKLAPLIGVVQTFFNQQKKEKSEENKEANET